MRAWTFQPDSRAVQYATRHDVAGFLASQGNGGNGEDVCQPWDGNGGDVCQPWDGNGGVCSDFGAPLLGAPGATPPGPMPPAKDGGTDVTVDIVAEAAIWVLALP